MIEVFHSGKNHGMTLEDLHDVCLMLLSYGVSRHASIVVRIDTFDNNHELYRVEGTKNSGIVILGGKNDG
jgi:hypothetical protein